MTSILKKAVSGLLEKMLTSATVADVRAWQPATMYEVDVYLPTINMEKWDSIKRLKCKVDDLQYRDYTPASWNPQTHMCTMYIEAGHNGAGGRWVKQLKSGDQLLFGAAHAAQLPAQEGSVLCLGDGSALGHFLALKQLTDRSINPIEAGIFLHDPYQIPISLKIENPDFEWIMHPESASLNALLSWCGQRDISSYTSVYIAGNIPMVTGLRKQLKAMPGLRAKIYAHGFWS